MAYVITVDWETCGGCGDCVVNCPAKLLTLDRRPAAFLAPPAAEDPEKVAAVSNGVDGCTGCMSCTAVCAREAVAVRAL